MLSGEAWRLGMQHEVIVNGLRNDRLKRERLRAMGQS